MRLSNWGSFWGGDIFGKERHLGILLKYTPGKMELDHIPVSFHLKNERLQFV